VGGLARCGRVFTRSPGFAAVIVLILALGIGANTAILSVLNALAFRELPVSRPERLVQVSGGYRSGSNVPFSFPMFEELNRGQRVFSTVLGWSGVSALNVDANGTLFPAGVRAVTADYFTGLEASPLLGRLIGPQDVRRNPVSQVAVISYEFWDRHLGRDPAIIGKTIRIEDQPFTIIGVTRQWFAGMTPGDSPGITVPCTASPFSLDSRALLWVFVTARLRDGVTPPQARAQLQSFWPELLASTVPLQSPGPRRQSFLAMKLQMESAATGINAVMRSQFVRPLDLLMGIAGLILLIVCVNLANLALARSAAHGYEMSTRIALGASRWHLIRQLLMESSLLSGAGAILALAFAAWGSRLLVVLMTKGSLLPVMLDTRPDWRVFAFTAATAALT
jgi:putative ABC transport system permease protein